MKNIEIVFCGHFQSGSGASEVIRNYLIASQNLNVNISISDIGIIDEGVRETFPIVRKTGSADIFVLDFESTKYLETDDIKTIQNTIPRKRVLIVDGDGKYIPKCDFHYDTNHHDEKSQEYWKELFDKLSDKIIHPLINEKSHFCLYGYPEDSKSCQVENSKYYDVLYVGNNWYRWKDLEVLINSISKNRSDFPNVAIQGSGWDKPLPYGRTEASMTDLYFLNRNKIDVLAPAKFGSIIDAMSKGSFNPIFVRPILHHMNFLTPRVFETFAANTFPLIPSYLEYLTKSLCADMEYFIYRSNPIEKMYEILENQLFFNKVKKHIDNELRIKHGYKKKIIDLVQLGFE